MEKSIMHHTIAWRASIADATETDVTPVQDILMAIANSHFLPQRDYALLYAHFAGLTADRARLVSPSLRQMTTPFIRPINGTIVVASNPGVADYSKTPLKIRGLEELQLLGTQTTGGAAVVVATAGLADGIPTPVPQGDILTMRGVATTTLVAGSWTTGAVTWNDTLAAGLYACVGLEYFGVTAIAARLIFEEQWMRPGTLGLGADITIGHPLFRKGNLGIWGKFNANRMPSIEFLANAADTAQEVYLDLMRIG
jgi:hypothetical protein